MSCRAIWRKIRGGQKAERGEKGENDPKPC